ncbi:MAG: hypothetical protein RL011_1512 [Pseudomonadota bacterium]|jgi:molybdenum cofactor synthesis domain-containing protein
MTKTAAILAVGSELLAGQIVNGNAAWLSTRLGDLGFVVTTHLTVDDVEADITRAIEQLTSQTDVLFITGGLGPTSDDLTRNAVATWASLPLNFDPTSWEHVKAQLARVGVAVPEANRQQCFFPTGALVLTNSAGTANGFSLKSRGKEIWVLPGPPREIEAIWQDHIHRELEGRVPRSERKTTKMWRMIGKGESHLAELITPVVQGHDVGVAYRVHAPYVELKVSFPVIDAAKHAPLCDQLTELLRPWLFETDQEHTPSQLVDLLRAYPTIAIIDMATQGHLAEMLTGHLRDISDARDILLQTQWRIAQKAPQDAVTDALDKAPRFALVLAVAGVDTSGNWTLGWRVNGQSYLAEYAAPFKHTVHRSRRLKAIAALAAKSWHSALSAMATP